jgi:hypothetical protein
LECQCTSKSTLLQLLFVIVNMLWRTFIVLLSVVSSPVAVPRTHGSEIVHEVSSVRMLADGSDHRTHKCVRTIVF